MAPPDKETSKWRGEREGGKGGGARPALFTIRASSAPLSLLIFIIVLAAPHPVPT